MHTWIDIDAAAVRHNYRLFCRLVGRPRLAPVLKSNAYGHGLREIYTSLAPENPPWLCTNYVFEATALRALGYEGRILVVGPAMVADFDEAASSQVDLVMGHWDILRAWGDRGGPFRIHLKFDTGMSRQGFLPDEAADVAAYAASYRSQVVGVCTHFANVEDVTEHDYARQQLKRFVQAAAKLRQAGFNLIEHAASSASTLLLDDSRFNLSRLGISLYGLWPSQATRISYLQSHGKLMDLRPVLTWRTQVTTVKRVPAGEFIGYGCTYRAVRDMTMAVLPVGYYEGYPRIAGDHSSYVLIGGQRAAVVGRICMNMMMVDVSHIESVHVGDQVTLIGQDGNEHLTASKVASWAQTIHYELVTGLNPVMPRHLMEHKY